MPTAEGVRAEMVEADAAPTDLPEPRPWDGTLRIVYSGLMCCRRSWEVLHELARRGGSRVKIDLHGILESPLADVQGLVAGLDNVQFHGRFKAPEELPGVFGGSDFAWIAHAYGDANSLWARANRFYQGGVFGLPLVAQRGTEDGRVVDELDLGPVIDLHRRDEAVHALLAIDGDDLERWRGSVRAQPRSLFVYTDDHERLLEALRG